MQVWLLDYEKFIKANGLQEVSDPMMFDAGNVPSKNGLFSTEIFGTSSSERRQNFAYIELNGKYINPKVYLTLKRLNRNFDNVIYGTKRYMIDHSGVLVEDEENGGTGIKWLYDNWEKIKFEKNDSGQRSERIDLLNTNKKDVIFTSKLVILPAFYRDINIQSTDSNPKVPEINDLYARIIRNVKITRDANTMDFVLRSVEGKIQETIVDIYNLIKDKIQGKSGYIRRFLMGKSVDYASRVVITAVPYTANSVHDQTVDYYHTGIPLAHTCSECTPFIVFWLKNWFKNNLENQANNFIFYDKKGEKQIVKLKNPASYFNEDYIENHIARFVKTPSSRFDKIEVPIADSDMERLKLKEYPYYEFRGMQLSGRDLNTVNKDNFIPNVSRHLTWTDLLYMAAVDVTADKHVWITRYPMLDYFGTFCTRITIISTRQTQPMMINGILYKDYPVIDLTKTGNLDNLFRDTINIAPFMLAGIGGDHDGVRCAA